MSSVSQILVIEVTNGSLEATGPSSKVKASLQDTTADNVPLVSQPPELRRPQFPGNMSRRCACPVVVRTSGRDTEQLSKLKQRP